MAFSIVNKNDETKVIHAGLTTFDVYNAFIVKRVDIKDYLIVSDGGYVYDYSDFKTRYPNKNKQHESTRFNKR